MTTNRRLARNTLFNFAGQAVPSIAALIAIPILIRGIGDARFGVLQLVWAAIGYFSLFDFGLGRALTHAIATRIGNGNTDEIAPLTRRALSTMLWLGVAGGAIVAALTHLLVYHVLTVPNAMRTDASQAFYILAAALPFTLLTTGLRGILEAHQDFGITTLLRAPLAFVNYFAPVLVLPFSHNLTPIVAALLAARIFGFVIHAVACHRRYAFLTHNPQPATQDAEPAKLASSSSATPFRSLLTVGAWMTLSNIIGPLMLYFDRFLIGALLPMAFVAWYVAPYEIVTELWLIPTAILGVLFPAFASIFVVSPLRAARLFDRGVRAVLVLAFPPCIALVALAHEGLSLWINREFASHSAPVMQWLVAGVFLNCVAQVAFTAVQGVGRPDRVAKFQLVELPFYVLGMWWATKRYGLGGVVAAWDIRAVVDIIVLFVLAERELPDSRAALVPATVCMTVLAALLVATAVPQTTAGRLAVMAGGLVLYAAIGWRWLVRKEERVEGMRWVREIVGGAIAEPT